MLKRDLRERLPDTLLITLDDVRTKLAVVWLVGCCAILLIVVLQSLLGRFADKTQEAWGWLLPTIMPTLGMIITVLGYTALEPQVSKFVVRKSFFRLAYFLSAMYLILVLLTILVQPFAARDPVELMRTSNLWLGPFQGLVASALGVLFVSKQQKKA
jgi:hypothetical protein